MLSFALVSYCDCIFLRFMFIALFESFLTLKHMKEFCTIVENTEYYLMKANHFRMSKSIYGSCSRNVLQQLRVAHHIFLAL